MPETCTIKTALFDLDGTLVDHFTTIYKCYCHVQQKLGLGAFSYEKVRATVGGSVAVTMERLVGKEHLAEALPLFHAHFEKIIYDDLLPLPGSNWILEELNAQGITCAVFTNKQGPAARQVCDHLGYTPFLKYIVGAGDTDYLKPHPEFTDHVLEAMEADPATTIMVGDSPFDVAAGKVRQLRSYCVTTGTHSEAELNAETPAPDAVFSDLVALGQTVFKLEAPR